MASDIMEPIMYSVCDAINDAQWPRFARTMLNLLDSEMDVLNANVRFNSTERKHEMLKLWARKNKPGKKAWQMIELGKLQKKFLEKDEPSAVSAQPTESGANSGAVVTKSSKRAGKTGVSSVSTIGTYVAHGGGTITVNSQNCTSSVVIEYSGTKKRGKKRKSTSSKKKPSKSKTARK